MAIQVFGAGAVQSAYVSYLALDITDNSLTLVWPSSYVDVPYTDPTTGISYQVLAASMDVMTPVDNVNTITLPDATEVSVGQNFIITNIGSSSFSLNKSDGSLLQVVATEISYWVQLTDNSTSAGGWRVITFGAGTSQASAATLAGNGLVALIDKLNTNVPVTLTNMVPIIDPTYRAKLIVWTGGSATLTLPTIGSVPAGYYVSFSNQSGNVTLTIQPGEGGTTISGNPTLTMQFQQSLTIISDGTNWQTLGFGQNQLAVVSSLTLDVSGNVNISLNPSQASNIIQEYVGTLTGNITVFFPVQASNWYIFNNTTGAFTLSVQLAGPTGTSYVIPQGSTQIFYSDGMSLSLLPTALSLINGTQATPALGFSSSPGTGIYCIEEYIIGLSLQGQEVVTFNINTPTSCSINLFSGDSTSLSIISDNEDASISYNGRSAIDIDNMGVVTLPAAPLPIGSGGTNATDAATALNNLMPSAAAGSIVYYDGINWQQLPIGSMVGQTLQVTSATTIGWV